jgi:hypothetical protein
MANTLDERDWEILLNSIGNRRCLPFLGAGACFGTLPLGSDIARALAGTRGFPFEDRSDLTKVATYVAVTYDSAYVKEKVIELLGDKVPDFTQPDEPHQLLAELNLPTYLTTNYDNFMVRALTQNLKDVRQELCRWHAVLAWHASLWDSQPDFRPTPANPVVYHLHGHTGEPQSLVLTEDDYLEFLAEMIRNSRLLPGPIQQAIATSTLLFIGYRLGDWNFRVLFQALRPNAHTTNIAVLVPPGDSAEERQSAMEYLDRYYRALDLHVYWGTAREFSAELRRRWSSYKRI